MDEQPIVINIKRWQSVLGVLLALIALGAAAWGGAAWAIDYKAQQAVDSKLQNANLVRMQELNNLRQLLDLRLTVMEKRLTEISDQVEYLYKREIERSDKKRGEP